MIHYVWKTRAFLQWVSFPFANDLIGEVDRRIILMLKINDDNKILFNGLRRKCQHIIIQILIPLLISNLCMRNRILHYRLKISRVSHHLQIYVFCSIRFSLFSFFPRIRMYANKQLYCDVKTSPPKHKRVHSIKYANKWKTSFKI